MDSFYPIVGIAFIALSSSGAGAFGPVGPETGSAIAVGSILSQASRSRSSCASPCRWRSHPDPDPAGRSRGEVRGLGHPPPVLHDVYEGQRDAVRYFRAGVDLAEQSGAGDQVLGEITGTRFIEILSGACTGFCSAQRAGRVPCSSPGLRSGSCAVHLSLSMGVPRRAPPALRPLVPPAQPRLLAVQPRQGGVDDLCAGRGHYGLARLFRGACGSRLAGAGHMGVAVVRPISP